MKVLFLTPWYPSDKDAMSGLFVQKHVEAVRAQRVDVRVIFSQTWRDTWRQWRSLQREGWLPDVVQLNVIQKQGLLALRLKKKYGIPYSIIEHWTGYLPETMSVKPHSLHTWFMKLICRNAEVVMPVSQPLEKAMKDLGFSAKKWELIDNVVDDFFYKSECRETEIPGKPKILLHVSCFDEPHKNVKGLLLAAKKLSEKRQDWQLVLVGTGIDYKEVRRYAEDLHIPSPLLRWTGELPPREVAKEMHRADVFVLSSRYETYGVVFGEAVAAGLPIISTPVGIAEEVADLIVPQKTVQHDSQRFAEYIEDFLWNRPIKIQNKDYRPRFSAEAVGAHLTAIYRTCAQG